MISIIISSYNEQNYQRCVDSIDATIGVEYEIVKIHNPGIMGIATAYNQGIQKAQYDIICCSHEDITMHTPNWGEALVHIFNDTTIGAVGVAGTKYLGNAPAAWWDFGTAHYVQHILQHRDGQQQMMKVGLTDENIIPVVAVDGVFIATRKQLGLQFDESVVGFHAYDLAFSMQCILRNLQVVVASQILIEHFSVGKIDKSWYQATDLFYEKYKAFLPVGKPAYSKVQIKNIEAELFKKYILNVMYDKKTAWKYWGYFLKRYPVSRFNLYFLKSIFSR